jgi:serine/threonine protein kinase
VTSVKEAGQFPQLIRFESFELNLRSAELRKSGQKVKLPEQSFRILAMLLEHAGEVVMRHEIQKKLWPNDTVVEFENSINTAIKKLRLALGDSAEQPRYIETLARRGYRWMVPVEWPERESAETRIAAPTVPSLPNETVSFNLTGKRVSHYRVLEILGGGGMGVVYKAEDLKLGRRVAVKFLPEELVKDTKALERFEREARSASALDHPNICAIHEFGEHDGQPFIVMPLLDGQTLRDRLASIPAPFALTEFLDLAVQIADGLEAAHEKGIIHRDIKPPNIFITNRGDAKILDFGLAKLTYDGDADGRLETRPEPAGDVSLTRTGIALGTAAYMSPEQVRGEKLDARTDLFSFGLVLYEMGTGQQAFSGETAVVLHDAILHRTPVSPRQVNPALPSKLEQIIDKALQKDREQRFQTAREMRAELEKLQQGTKPRRWVAYLKAAAASFLALLAGIGVIFWPTSRHSPVPDVPGLKQRQLTDNSSDNPILSGAISPDGRYLAYVDLKGIHVKLIETGEMRTLPQPAELGGRPVKWNLVPTWLRDGTGFIANANSGNLFPDLGSVWMFPVLGGSPRKLRDNAEAYSVSRDGSWIVFYTNLSGGLSYREMWVMRSNGTQARKVYEGDDNKGFEGAEWSPDGRRLSYVSAERGGGGLVTRDLNGGPVHSVLPSGVQDHVWSPDGRIIYSLDEPGLWANSCNYWAVPIDTSTGKPKEPARRLTNWAGFCMDSSSPTGDGRRLAFRKWAWQGNVYVADLKTSGTNISPPRHLTSNEGRTYPAAWTPDSESMIVESYRDGHWRILRQSLADSTIQPLVSGSDGAGAENEDVVGGATVSPDGNWLLYLAQQRAKAHYSEAANAADATTRQLKRVPITGGLSESVLTATLYGRPHCARAPATLCVMAERSLDLTQLVFTAIDAWKGRGRELARWHTEASTAARYGWDLSPDGTQIAVLKYPEPRIHLLPLNGQATQEVIVRGWDNLHSVNWTADGKGVFVASATQEGSAILHVDLTGKTRVLWEQKGTFTWSLPFFDEALNGTSTPAVVPSPDGRHLAIYDWKLTANMWMMENY